MSKKGKITVSVHGKKVHEEIIEFDDDFDDDDLTLVENEWNIHNVSTILELIN